MLKDLIQALEAMPQNATVRFGFADPHSYRGYYDDLSFKPLKNARISDMLEHARSALGKTFRGWKGGNFRMNEYTDCWISEEGFSSGQSIGPTLLNYWKAETMSSNTSFHIADTSGEK